MVAYVFPPYAVGTLSIIRQPGSIMTGNMVGGPEHLCREQPDDKRDRHAEHNAIVPDRLPLRQLDLSSSANLIVTSTSTQNTFLTVEGNGILTANFAPPTVAITQETNAIADVGRYEYFTATVTNGNGQPYTYNWIASNAVSGALIGGANVLFTAAPSRPTPLAG